MTKYLITDTSIKVDKVVRDRIIELRRKLGFKTAGDLVVDLVRNYEELEHVQKKLAAHKILHDMRLERSGLEESNKVIE